MCGISGIIALYNSFSQSDKLVRDMCQQIVHRGPDEEGYYWTDRIALGMRRLSIIDLEEGSQPIFNEDRSVCVIQNGEIYNYRELRKKLKKAGHRFSTHSDTEVIVHLYEDFGEEFVDHLNGMFAIALWDEQKQKLILVRDRLGVKPLFYSHIDDSIIFGSEIKCILQHPKVNTTLDYQAAYDYFTLGYVPQPRTIYRQIRKLPPGSRMVVRKGQFRIDRYWTVPDTNHESSNYDDAKSRLRELLTDATRIRLFSDVPLGAFLSGGVDSSITVALMARLSSSPVKTFFIDFEESAYSEKDYARAIAKKYHTEHHEFVMRPDAVNIVEELLKYFDEPFADSSAIPTYYLSKMTKEHVTVALAGDGGDESFGGYNRYRAVLNRKEMRFLRRIAGPVGSRLHHLLPRTAPGRRYFRSFGQNNHESFVVGTQEMESRDFLSREFLSHVGKTIMEETNSQSFFSKNGHDRLQPYATFDLNWYLPDDILTKVDRMSMAHSLEIRSPFLDYRIIEFASGLPTDWKINRKDTKVILKDTFQEDLTPEVMNPRKRGFSIPLAEWFRNELRETLLETVHDSEIKDSGIFNISEIEGLVNEHLSGARSRKSQLWRFLVFARWLKTRNNIEVVHVS